MKSVLTAILMIACGSIWLPPTSGAATAASGFAQVWADPPASRARLEQAAEPYRKQLANGGWPRIDDGPTLRLGDESSRVLALRARLGNPGPATFDAALDAAVREFQARHGLATDGVVGPATLGALNVPVAARLAQIEAALAQFDRLASPGDAYVVVNLAAMLLAAVEGGAPALEMRVIVGRQDWQTPQFSSRFASVTFSPSWTVPARIAATEVRPRALRQPDYLLRNGIEIVDLAGRSLGYDIRAAEAKTRAYFFRQKPGERNALGRVRLAAPNPYDIFLHGTPATELFERPIRAFSHGCIRLERPVELARWLLSDQPHWDDEAIASAIARNEPVLAPVTRPAALHIVYATAWADASGSVHFRPDLYRLERPYGGSQSAAPIAEGCPGNLEERPSSG